MTHRIKGFLAFCFVCPFAILLGSAAVHAAPEDTTADAVVGQSDFSSNNPNQGNATPTEFTINECRGLIVDPVSGRLFVADTLNNRVVSWPDADAFMNGDAADLVFGQADFTGNMGNRGGVNPTDNTLFGPRSVAVDSAGRLYIADSLNIRILRFDPPFTNGMSAVQVFGQGGDFTTNNQANAANADANNLGNPDGIAIDADDNLYLADRFLHRVFVYLDPVNTDTTADIVIGQPDFTSVERNQNDATPTPQQNTLNNPIGVGLDAAGNLYVADEGNNRVLLFETPLANNQNATRVYGQADFTGGTANDPAISATSMNGPVYVAIDPVSGNLFVADAINNRVLEFADPRNDSTADRVFGQNGDFTTNTANNGGVSADSLSDVGGVAVDSDGNLYAGDRLNHRVLRYDAAEPDPGNGNNNDNDNDNTGDSDNDNDADNGNDNTGGGDMTPDMPCGNCGQGGMMVMPLIGACCYRRRRKRGFPSH